MELQTLTLELDAQEHTRILLNLGTLDRALELRTLQALNSASSTCGVSTFLKSVFLRAYPGNVMITSPRSQLSLPAIALLAMSTSACLDDGATLADETSSSSSTLRAGASSLAGETGAGAASVPAVAVAMQNRDGSSPAPAVAATTSSSPPSGAAGASEASGTAGAVSAGRGGTAGGAAGASGMSGSGAAGAAGRQAGAGGMGGRGGVAGRRGILPFPRIPFFPRAGLGGS